MKEPVRVSPLPRVSQRAPAFVRQVLAGVRGPFVDNVVTNCIIRVSRDTEERQGAFNIQDLAWRLVGKRDPLKFRASTTVRLHGDPSATYLMFPSECIVMTGVRCPELVLCAALRIARYYSSVFRRGCHLEAYRVNNVHGVINMGYPLDLMGLHKAVAHSLYHSTNIKCVIFTISVPFKPNVPPTKAAMYHLLEPVTLPAPDYMPTAAHATPAGDDPPAKEPPRKKRRKRASVEETEENYCATDAPDAPLPLLAKSNTRPSSRAPATKRTRDKVAHGWSNMGSVFTTAQIEVFDKVEQTVTGARKKPKDPNHIAVNVWESGKVGLTGRSEEHLFAAAVELSVLLAEFTLASVPASQH